VANQEELKRRIEAFIQKGGQVLASSRKLSSKSSASTLDASAFNHWKTQSLSFLMQLRGADDVYTTRFEKEVQNRYESDVKSGIGVLKALYEDLDFASQVPYNAPSAQTNNVFVVHGHDEEMKQAIARTLARLGLQPIILHEQPNQGKTLIEKFERRADVQFAAILLSPDDMGYVKTASADHAQARPRQNVILELGYFVGKLTKERVFALKREGDLELPNDIAGLVYTPYDAAGHWRFELVRELKAAGYTVDANSLI
jgi:predicted nucleotide-binding protein